MLPWRPGRFSTQVRGCSPLRSGANTSVPTAPYMARIRISRTASVAHAVSHQSAVLLTIALAPRATSPVGPNEIHYKTKDGQAEFPAGSYRW